MTWIDIALGVIAGGVGLGVIYFIFLLVFAFLAD